ncbi:hypothetical protein BC829DRAFT_193905 [Chytridium lagenaria]|nr:hypothetical protein BC829DRAFT_193905 [Chytridium lagenaria]
MATVDSQIDDVLNHSGNDTKWVILGRTDDGETLQIVGKGQAVADLRQQLKGAKGASIGLLAQSGTCLSFRYGVKSKELIAAHDVKALIKQHPSFVVTNIDADLTDDTITKQSRLPNLPSKLADQETDFSRASSTESMASLTAEEKEEEIKALQKRTEEINLSAQRKSEEAARYKAFNETLEKQRKENAEKDMKEQAEIQKMAEKFKQTQPETAFEGWLSFHKESSNVWHRRWIGLKKPHDFSVWAEANSQRLQQYSLSGAKISDGENETGMRNSLSVQVPGQEQVYVLADNRTEYYEVLAALRYLA